MADWEKLPCHPGRGRGTPYWSFIDTKLDKLRIRCTKPTKPATEATVKRYKFEARAFTYDYI
jgi:hypothetical protein